MQTPTLANTKPDRRFTIELDFVQCLANPHYIQCRRAAPDLQTSRRTSF